MEMEAVEVGVTSPVVETITALAAVVVVINKGEATEPEEEGTNKADPAVAGTNSSNSHSTCNRAGTTHLQAAAGTRNENDQHGPDCGGGGVTESWNMFNQSFTLSSSRRVSKNIFTLFSSLFTCI